MYQKSKFIEKFKDFTKYNHFVYLVYEYRGKQYTVYENLDKGNESLSWQHARARAEIDAEIERENRPKNPDFIATDAQTDFDIFYSYLNGEISDKEFSEYCESNGNGSAKI